MRKAFAITLTLAVASVGIPVGVFAAGAGAGGQATGAVTGTAKDAAQKDLAKVKVQVRGPNGQLAATGTTNTSGGFSFAGLAPGNYTIEILDAAGNIVGTSAAVTVTSGALVSVTVTAAAAGAIAAATGGGLALMGLGPLGSVAVLAAAGAGTIASIVATKDDASPSK